MITHLKTSVLFLVLWNFSMLLTFPILPGLHVLHFLGHFFLSLLDQLQQLQGKKEGEFLKLTSSTTCAIPTSSTNAPPTKRKKRRKKRPPDANNISFISWMAFHGYSRNVLPLLVSPCSRISDVCTRRKQLIKKNSI
jgi:hypothetical protein